MGRKGREGAEPLVQLCQPRAWVPSAASSSSGQQHPIPPCTLEWMGLAPSCAPMGYRELADVVSIPPCWRWRRAALLGLGRALPCLWLLGQLSEPVLGLHYVQAAR